MFRKANSRDSTVQGSSMMNDRIISQAFVMMSVIRLFICGFFILGLTGCSVTRSISQTERTFLEQVLITQSIKSSLEHAEISLPASSSVQVVTAGLTDDRYFATEIFKGWLGQQGYRVLEENADYEIRVIWHGLGTGHNEFFFGIPPINSTFIPFATPELSLYKAVRDDAMARLSINILKKENGQFISSTPAYEGDAYYDVKTLLFGFTFESTNLASPLLQRDSML